MKYEIHTTVFASSVEKFKSDCMDLGIKAVLIDTQKGETQMMTSSRHENEDYPGTLEILNRGLAEKGYRVLRNKVEKFPEENPDNEFIYYESHMRLRLGKGTDTSTLKMVCKLRNFHFSRNLLKSSETHDYQMITYRDYERDLKKFNSRIEEMKKILDILNISYDKIEIEECIHDSRISMDDNWLEKA